MNNKLDKRRLFIFLGFAFGIAWAVALIVYRLGGLAAGRVLFPGTNITEGVALVALGFMWAPALANILTRLVTREGRKNTWLGINESNSWVPWALAWILPTILTLLGVLVYFVIFPNQFDPELGTLQSLIRLAEAQSGQTVPLEPWTILLIQVGEAILLAPVLNGFFTFGEEFGWRAYLQPKLLPLGYRKGLLLTGVIWGLWHAPIIAMGHNYGFGYFGAPWTGMIAMTWFTMAAGVFFGWMTLRAGSVWPAVIAHASINGVAGIAVLFLKPDADFSPLLGPLPVGFIGGIPWLVLAIYLLWKGDPRAQENVSRETLPTTQSPAPTGAMIETQGLGKHFGTVDAVEDLNLSIPAGEVFGLLGPNGAGKTTTIRMLAALIAPSAGAAWVAGHRVGEENTEIRKAVGILTETPGLYEGLSAERNLAFFAELYEVENIPAQVERYLRMLGLWARRSESVGTFSKGMRQKLAIARALLHEPQVLFLDEPTSGLDPEAAHLVRDFVSELRSEGRTIVLTTHNLDEADRLCDRIAVLKTRMLALDTPSNLRRNLFGRAVVFHLATVNEGFANAVRQKDYVKDVEVHEGKLVVKLDDPEKRNPELIRELIGLGADVQFVGELRQSLEDVYLQLVGQPAEAK